MPIPNGTKVRVLKQHPADDFIDNGLVAPIGTIGEVYDYEKRDEESEINEGYWVRFIKKDGSTTGFFFYENEIEVSL